MRESLLRIIKEIQATELAIQWDSCFEILALELEQGRKGMDESLFKPFFSPATEGILERLYRLCEIMPENVSLGFHFCYGDYHHQHFVEPENLAILVDLVNDILQKIGSNIHTVEWIHMPVPKTRNDTVYF